MPYIGNQPGTGVRNRFIYTATASQTTFSGADDNGKTLKYADSDFVDVYLNGICLVPVTDYTSTSKTSVVLTQAASLNDTLEVIAYDIATIADTVSKADGGTFEANVTFADGADILTASKGTDNVRIGEDAGASIISGGNQNTLIGKVAGTAITTGDDNVAVGAFSLNSNTTASDNTACGYSALEKNTTGDSNTAVGYKALEANTTAPRNTAVGFESLKANTTGDRNVAVGATSLDACTSGQYNTAVGNDALTTLTTGDNNVAVGINAGAAVTTGGKNTVIGSFAGDGLTTSSDNVALGYQALSAASGGTNVAVGSSALAPCTGYDSTALGHGAGGNTNSTINCMFLGHDSGITGSPGGNVVNNSNVICIGDENISAANIQVSLNVASDQRDKTDFTALDLGLDFVKELAPVTYRWDKRSKYGDKYAEDYDLNEQTPDGTHKEDWLDVGFKAQEVEALESAAGYKIADKTNLITTLSEDGNQYGMQYEKFIPVLVKAIQELSAKNDALETENTAIKSRLDALEAG